MIIFSINAKYQFKTLSFILSVLGFIILMSAIYLVDIKSGFVNINKERYNGNYLPVLIPLSLITIPSAYLYLEYLFFNYGMALSIDVSDRKIHLKTRKSEHEYAFSQIEKITKVCSFPAGENRLRRMPTDTFSYHVIELENNCKIIVSSLIVDDFRINGVRNDVKKKFIPAIIPLDGMLLNIR